MNNKRHIVITRLQKVSKFCFLQLSVKCLNVNHHKTNEHVIFAGCFTVSRHVTVVLMNERKVHSLALEIWSCDESLFLDHHYVYMVRTGHRLHLCKCCRTVNVCWKELNTLMSAFLKSFWTSRHSSCHTLCNTGACNHIHCKKSAEFDRWTSHR